MASDRSHSSAIGDDTKDVVLVGMVVSLLMDLLAARTVHQLNLHVGCGNIPSSAATKRLPCRRCIPYCVVMWCNGPELSWRESPVCSSASSSGHRVGGSAASSIAASSGEWQCSAASSIVASSCGWQCSLLHSCFIVWVAVQPAPLLLHQILRVHA